MEKSKYSLTKEEIAARQAENIAAQCRIMGEFFGRQKAELMYATSIGRTWPHSPNPDAALNAALQAQALYPESPEVRANYRETAMKLRHVASLWNVTGGIGPCVICNRKTDCYIQPSIPEGDAYKFAVCGTCHPNPGRLAGW